MTLRRGATVCAGMIVAALLGCAAPRPTPQPATPSIPARLTDDEFWKMVSGFSEPGGYFRSDNFVSNEVTFQHVIPELVKGRAPGGVYLGVGPDQNFTYLVALQPKIAFIFDIRRQNVMQHLMYKALIESAPSRADFVSRLFSRPRPPGLDTSASATAIFTALAAVPPESALYRATLAAIHDRLVTRHHFTLSTDDERSIEYIFGAFFAAGPELTYSFAPPGSGSFGMGPFGRRMPTYAALMVETDSAGVSRGYLATEKNFRILKDLETNNLIVPLVGDFAGPRAIRTVGTYLKEHRATVTAFYLSNVEQYLFRQNDDWQKFFGNAAALPVDEKSTFIRAVFNMAGFRDPAGGGPRSITMLASIAEQVKAFGEGRIVSYYDVVNGSR